MCLVKFRDKDHAYFIGKKKYTSVSGVFKTFQEPFDAPNKSLMKAYRDLMDPGQYNMFAKKARDYPYRFVQMVEAEVPMDMQKEALKIAKEYAKQWSNAGIEGSSFGTERHSEKEQIDIDRGWSKNPYTGKKFEIPDHYYQMRKKYKQYDNVQMAEDLSTLPDGYYPEFLISVSDWAIAGQADKAYIETINGVRYLDLDDWKTDKEIKTKGFFHKNRGMQKLLFPLDHIPDCNRFAYEIKISLYAYMCEQHGLVPRNLGFTHLIYNEDRTKEIDQKLYKLMYRRWECGMMIDQFMAPATAPSSS